MSSELEVRQEVRLAVSPEFVMPSLGELAATRELHVEQEAGADDTTTDHLEARFASEYFDTTDLRLVRRGVTLQRRQGDGTSWIIELPRPTKNGSRRADCRLIEIDDGSTEPPDSLLDLL